MSFSRSRSMESMTRSRTEFSSAWCWVKAPDCHSIPSTSVVLPWSTWAMMARLRRSARTDTWIQVTRLLRCLTEHAQAQRLGQREEPFEDLLREVRRDVGDDEADLAAGAEVLGLDVDALLGHQAVDGGQHARGVAVHVHQ